MAVLPRMPQVTLDEFRMQLGLSQRAVAAGDPLGSWDQAAVSHFLTQPNPRLQNLVRFAEAVGADLKLIAVKDGHCYELLGP
jgi:hypothetical protein